MGIFKSAGKWIKGAGKTIGKETIKAGKNVGKAAEAVGDVVEDVVDLATDAAEDVGDLVEPVARPVVGGIKDIGEEIKRFADDAIKKGFKFIVDKGKDDPLVRQAIQEIKNHQNLVVVLTNTVEKMKDKNNYNEIFGEIVKPIAKGKIKGAEAQRRIESLSKHPALVELFDAAEEDSGDEGGWCVSFGVVLDVPLAGIGGQAAGGVAVFPARLYGALSWSMGIAVGASVDGQIGLWFRKTESLPGKFQAVEIDLHIPQFEIGGVPAGASVAASFDTDSLWIEPANVPGHGDGYATGGIQTLQGFIGSIGVGLGGELYNRSAGHTWVTGT